MENRKESHDLRLWLLVGLCAVILIGVGALIAALSGNGLAGLFGKFSPEDANYQLILTITIIVAAVFVVGGFVGLYFYNQKYPNESTASKWSLKTLLVGALCIGLSFVLSYITIWKMPNGGSITPASMLPIMIFAYIYGTPKGIIVGIAYGLLQMIQDPWLVNFWQVMLDYIVAFGALSLAGLFRKNIIPGIICGCMGRFVSAFLAGVIFWGSYAPEGVSPVVYSLGYQATYIIPEMILCIVITLIPGIRKMIEQLKTQALSVAK